MVLFASIILRWCGEYDWKRKYLFIDLAMRILSTTRAESFLYDYWSVYSMKAIELLAGSHLFVAYLGEWYDEGGFAIIGLAAHKWRNTFTTCLFKSRNGKDEKQEQEEEEDKEEE